jgi:hypothetical protein
MTRAMRYLGQGVVYVALALLLGYFANSPSYTHFPPDKALIKLSLVHSADHISECRRLTAEEIAALPENMRRPLDCPRQRLPVIIELELDGVMIFDGSLAPTGLAGDGPSKVYERFPVDPGRHNLVARLRDSRRTEGFDYEHTADVDLAPGQNLVIDFRAETGGFIVE